ncbi:MAG: TonB family protein [Flavitalea sp.]
MKNALILFAFLLITLIAFTQSSSINSERIVSMSYLDAQGNPTNEAKKMAFISRIIKSDSVYRWEYYNYSGPLFYSKSYKDPEMTVLSGQSVFYTNGIVDSVGNYKDNLQDGIWLYGGGYRFATKNFKDGKLVEQSLQEKDSLKKMLTKDSLSKSAEYEGGLTGWRDYLVKNFKYPERAMRLDVQGTVLINFMIDAEGNVLNPFIGRSVEMSIDDASIRLIKLSSKWVPAEMQGRKVKCFFVQPVTFRLQ